VTITARYPGRCSRCRGRIEAGETVNWDRRTRTVSHAPSCDPVERDRAAAEHRKAEAEKAVAVAASRAAEADLEVPAPEGLEYLPFQRAGIAYAMARPAVLIGDDMGLGKTVQAAGLINADSTVRRVLVVCPASLRLNWQRELERWLVRPATISIATTAGLPETDVVIANWDILSKLRPLIDAVAWDLAIFDESHFGKTETAQRTIAAFGRRGRRRSGSKPAVPEIPGIRARRRLCLTGTPIPNRPIEIWPMLHYLDPANWKSFWAFAKRYCGAYDNGYGWDLTGASNLEELQERLRSTLMVRRLKGQVLTELPAKRRQVVELPANGCQRFVDAENEAWAAHRQEIEEAEAAVELSKAGAPGDYEEAVARLRKAHQIAFSEISRARHDTAVAKTPAVAEFVRDQLEGGDQSVVIMAHHHDVVRILAEELGSFGVVVLTGETPMAERQQAVDRFQAGEARVFIGGILAAGVGLTLTRASWVVFAELDWVPGNVTQAEDRCHRIGQTESVLIQHVVLQDSLDANMANTLVAKQTVIDRALDRVTEITASTSKRPAATATTRRQDLEEQAAKLTDAQVEAIHEGLRILRGHCDGAHDLDGAGFSRIDVRIGHSLAEAPRLTKRQAALGLKLVIKYQRQLGGDLLGAAKGER
jgi:SWI/SNF-related matrix-associated actin-dependent regulator 1 of chromatin subfamily A